MENKTIVLDGIEYELVLKEDTRTESEVEKSEIDALKEKYASGSYICCVLNYIKNYRYINEAPIFNLPSCNYKLIHKRDELVLKAYLENTKVEIEGFMSCGIIEYKPIKDTWIKVDNFIDSYDESNQYRLKETKKEFKPFDLTIRLNTIEEVKSLWNRLNISDKKAYEKNIEGGVGYKLDNDLDNEETPFYAEWDKVDDVLRELGEEPSAKEIVEESKLEFIQKHLAKIVGRICGKDSDEIFIGKDINFNIEHSDSFGGYNRKCCNVSFEINTKGKN